MHKVRAFIARSCAPVCLVLSLALSTQALSRTFGEGYKSYARGNFVVAEKQWTEALKTTKNTQDRAKLFKYLGIAQYMQRKMPQAQQSFRAAIAAAPATNIDKSEVLDEKVIPFFNQVKGQSRSTNATARRPQPAAQKPARGTFLIINSNVANATVLLNGIIAGKAGSTLEVDAGVTEAQLNAPGYISKRARIRVVANQTNTVTINLEKPKPPAPKVVANPPAARNKQAPSAAPRNRNGYDFLPDPTRGNSLFSDNDSLMENDGLAGGRNLQHEFALDAIAPTAPVIQQPVPQPQYPPAYGMQQPSYPMYQQPPVYAQPPYPYPTQPYAPTYPPYQPYQQPYAVPQPYATQPVPQMQPSAPAPIPIPGIDSPADDSGEFTLPAERSSGSGPRVARRSPAISRTRSAKVNDRISRPSTSGTDVFISLMPFGAGQFNQGKIILGSLFALSEIGAVYWWYSNKSEADAAAAEWNEFREDPNATDAQKLAFSQESEAYVKQKRAQQNYGLYGFIGLWVVGAGEALFNPPAPKKPSILKRRVTEIQIDDSTSSFRLADDDSRETDYKPAELPTNHTYESKLSFGIIVKDDNELNGSKPQRDAPQEKLPGIGIGANWTF